MSRQLVSIQVLRALAALAVTIAHTNPEIDWIVIVYLHQQTSGLPGMVTGAAGVNLFFVISGFVMVYSSQRLFGSVRGMATFAARRLLRIVPLYWIGTAVFLVVWYTVYGTSLAQESATWRNVIESLLFIPPTRVNGLRNPIMGQGWSLNYEMFFYMMFAAFVAFPRRAAVIGLGLFIILFVNVGSRFVLPDYFAYFCNGMLSDFVLGLAIGLAYTEGLRLPRVLAWGAILAGTGALIFDAASPEVLLRRELMWGVPSALLVAGAVSLEGDNEWQGGLITRFVVLVGSASYSLYLFHGMVMDMFRTAFLSVGVWLSQWPWILLAAMVVASVAVAIVIHLYIEKPMTEWLRRERPHRSMVAIPSAP